MFEKFKTAATGFIIGVLLATAVIFGTMVLTTLGAKAEGVMYSTSK